MKQQHPPAAGDTAAHVAAARQLLEAYNRGWFLADEAVAETPIDDNGGVATALQQLAQLTHRQCIDILRALHAEDPAAAAFLGALLAGWEAGDTAGFDAGYEYAITEAKGETADEQAMLEEAQRLAGRMRWREVLAA